MAEINGTEKRQERKLTDPKFGSLKGLTKLMKSKLD